MSSTPSPTCYVIGGESLLIQCCEVLLENDFEILGVVSAQPAIVSWAAAHNLPGLRPGAELAAAVASRPPDYIFSIANLAILPAAVVNAAARAAINFHDGPLPQYAGLYTTSWAIIERQPSHGVTWHCVEGGIDEGDILKQETFPLDAGETALTLNARCYEAGLRTFKDLAAELRSGTAVRRRQDLSLRRYFELARRPEAACAIAWDQCAEDVTAMVRGLDFGGYANPLGLAKARLNGRWFASGECEPAAATGDKAPGTIVAAGGGGLTVAVAGGSVNLRRLLALDGSALNPAQALPGALIGERLDAIEPQERAELSELHAAVARHESFWVERLESFTPPDLPYLAASGQSSQGAPGECRSVDLPAGHVAALQAAAGAASAGDAVAATVCALLARLGGSTRLDTGFTEPSLRRRVGAHGALFAPSVPLCLACPEHATAREALAAVVEDLGRVRRRVTHAADAVGRYPQLRTRSKSLAGSPWPLRIELVDRLLPACGRAMPAASALWTVYIESASGRMVWETDPGHITGNVAAELARRLLAFAGAVAADPEARLVAVPTLDAEEVQRVTRVWNATQTEVPRDKTIHQLFQEQAGKTPGAVAVAFEDETITYAALDARSNQIARHLRALGVGPEVLVGVFLERSLELIASLLGILKAGGAYVPLDPGYPAERLELMLADSDAAFVLTQERLRAKAPPFGGRVVVVDEGADAALIAQEPDAPPAPAAAPDNAAYVIYTSGSTGKPKGVVVEHRNAVNFFCGMDARIERPAAGVWLAVTSLSFDISVLELFWTLTRGFKVVLHGERSRSLVAGTPAAAARRPLELSLYYFASDERRAGSQKYRLLLEGAKFADAHGFTAVWSPERHFHPFGGLYPNPSVVGAAVAAVTERVQIRAGSVVSPLHHPARIAEEWALVDNLSNGRVGISFASGWHPDDFVLRPENHADAKSVMLRDIDQVRRLWRGEKVPFPGPKGEVLVGTLPRPVQKELPVWITAAGNPDTFRAAGEIGANLLTHLLGQTIDELDAKIAAYRRARSAAGHAGPGHVTLMLHTFVGESDQAVRDTVREPMIEYLRSAAGLIRAQASSFPAFRKRVEAGTSADQAFRDLGPEDLEGLLQHAFERYYDTSGLFGTVESCERMLERVKAIGVDEVACLIDFGVPTEAALEGLHRLDELRRRHEAACAASEHTLPGQIARHGVSHLQCTPSMALMLLAAPDSRDALRGVQHLLVGGEALPPSLAAELRQVIPGTVTNMYGPTETTVWSSTHRIDDPGEARSIGRPVANTQFYILDRHLELVPPGLPGELFIGGDGVARGYLRRPELTAERFVQTRHQPGRLYRTGDLVRHLPDGQVEFLGRLDHQVKIRGYRIELGEIEERLREHPGVKDAVVVAREDSSGDRRLVAYFVPSPARAAAPDPAELRQHLQSRLPEFMVPAQVVPLPALPLTPNGKVDRKALPAPEGLARAVEKTFVQLENGLESVIGAVWQEVLGVPRVGADDNFFDLGGHSLLVVQVLARLRDATGRNLPITDVFRFPTVRGLARYLEVGDHAAAHALDTSHERGSARRELLQRRRARQA